MSPTPVSCHVVGAVLLLMQLMSGAVGNVKFVGEQFTFYCGGTMGYWQYNGAPLGQYNTSYTGTATIATDGVYNCTNRDGTVSFSSATLEVYGLIGVTPSPLNCSAIDDSTNTCAVSASMGSPLTLCANFTRYPVPATRYAELVKMQWQQSANNERTTIWRCGESQCTNEESSVGSTYTEEWGRCLHLERVEEDSVFFYNIHQLSPSRSYPNNLPAGIHREVVFSVQVGSNSLPSSTLTTSNKPTTSATFEPPSVTVTFGSPSSSVIVTPSIGPISSSPPPNELEIVLPVILVLIFVVAVVITSIVAILLFRKTKRSYNLRKSSRDCIIDPELQRSNTLERNKSRPCELPLEQELSGCSYPPTYSSPSSQRPLLPADQQSGPPNSFGLPSYRTATTTNGHTSMPHPLVTNNGTVHNTYCAEPGTQQSLASRNSNRDSLMTFDLPDFEHSPEALT